MRSRCEFEVDKLCYAESCQKGIECGCKDKNDNINYASLQQRAKRKDLSVVMPKLTVLPPTVINISNTFQNVASKGMDNGVDYDTEQSVILPKL